MHSTGESYEPEANIDSRTQYTHENVGPNLGPFGIQQFFGCNSVVKLLSLFKLFWTRLALAAIHGPKCSHTCQFDKNFGPMFSHI